MIVRRADVDQAPEAGGRSSRVRFQMRPGDRQDQAVAFAGGGSELKMEVLVTRPPRADGEVNQRHKVNRAVPLSKEHLGLILNDPRAVDQELVETARRRPTMAYVGHHQGGLSSRNATMDFRALPPALPLDFERGGNSRLLRRLRKRGG